MNDIKEKKGLPQADLKFNLERGLEAEKNALDLCNDLIMVLKKSSEIEVVSKIANDEKRHIKMVENLLEIVVNYYVSI